MEEIELAPNIYLNVGAFMGEALLSLPILLLWPVIYLSILLKSYQGIRKKIKGANYIFIGIFSSLLISIVSVIILTKYEHVIYDFPSLPNILELISSSLMLIACWSFKVLVDGYSVSKDDEST